MFAEPATAQARHSIDCTAHSALLAVLQSVCLCANKAAQDLCRVDLGIHNHPGTPPELRPGGQIHNDWLLVCAQVLHYQGASLKQHTTRLFIYHSCSSGVSNVAMLSAALCMTDWMHTILDKS